MQQKSKGYFLGVVTLSFLTTAILFTTSCAKEALTPSNNLNPETNANVIYGTDGREDVYQADQNLKVLADSTVALIKNTDLTTRSGQVTISTTNYGSSLNLCSSEKFREQGTAAFCSGSLVGNDTIITAGHCITNQSDCNSTSFVFGFAVKSAGVLPQQVADSEVYRCREIIKQVLTNGADFAVIKLDRPVTNHAVLQIRQSGQPSVGDPLVVIGHPVGLPTKITVGGQVRSIANADFLVTNLDTYGGNSGSAVFNAVSGQVEGILVRGEQDFIAKGSCQVSNVCTNEGCRGEDVTRISVVRPYLAQTTPPPPQPPQPPPPAPPASGTATFSSNAVVAIPDNNQTGVSSLIAVNDTPKGRKVSVSVNITHPYIGDLVLKLVASDGKSTTLQSRLGGSADNIVKTYDVTSALGQVSLSGNYKLVVQDLAARDIGKLNSWSLKFQ